MAKVTLPANRVADPPVTPGLAALHALRTGAADAADCFRAAVSVGDYTRLSNVIRAHVNVFVLMD